ncbi:MAG: asparagine synthetase A [Candidatus Heimdallarchaeaceae archaeon]
MNIDLQGKTFEKRYDMILEDRICSALIIQDRILGFSRQLLEQLNYIEILAPLIGPATDPGIRGAKRVSFDYYGQQYKVMSSIILYKQALIRAFDKVYAFAPNVRLEPLESESSKRHLCEFYQLDLEVKEKGMFYVMEETERFFVELIKKIKESSSDILTKYDRALRVPKLPFKKLSYYDALDKVRELGYEIKDGMEIPHEAEEKLSKEATDPFWIIDYPVGSRGFYYREDPDKPGTLLSMDLIYPEGFGEASSGGEREIDVRKVKSWMKKSGELVSEYVWYLDMLETSGKASAGLGIGVERLTKYILGFSEIEQCTAFPKIAGKYSI